MAVNPIATYTHVWKVTWHPPPPPYDPNDLLDKRNPESARFRKHMAGIYRKERARNWAFFHKHGVHRPHVRSGMQMPDHVLTYWTTGRPNYNDGPRWLAEMRLYDLHWIGVAIYGLGHKEIEAVEAFAAQYPKDFRVADDPAYRDMHERCFYVRTPKRFDELRALLDGFPKRLAAYRIDDWEIEGLEQLLHGVNWSIHEDERRGHGHILTIEENETLWIMARMFVSLAKEKAA
jgi:hypothetical protein